jgi:hypothetical protein
MNILKISVINAFVILVSIWSIKAVSNAPMELFIMDLNAD